MFTFSCYDNDIYKILFRVLLFKDFATIRILVDLKQ